MTDITNIQIEYTNTIDTINIEEIDPAVSTILIEEVSPEITVIEVEKDAQSIYAVNGLIGNVILTASATLTFVSASGGIYSYTFIHNLDYDLPYVYVYDDSSRLVYPDIVTVDADSVIIKSAIDISGYKVVAHR